MKKIFLFLIFFFTVICLKTTFIYPGDLPQELIDFGLDFIENPSDLFFNLEQNIEDCTPLPAGQTILYKNKRFGVRMNVFPTLLPITLGNISFKIRFNKENLYLPQFNFVFGFGNIFALNLISNKDEEGNILEKPENKIYYYGLFISKTFEDTVLYLGFRNSEFLLKVKFPEEIEFYGSTLESINFKINENFIFTGIMLPQNLDRFITAQISYGLNYKKIVARLGLEKNNLQIGIDIFPEGLLVFHPYVAYSWKF